MQITFSPGKIAAAIWTYTSGRILSSLNNLFTASTTFQTSVGAGVTVDLRPAASTIGFDTFAQQVVGIDVIMYDGTNSTIIEPSGAGNWGWTYAGTNATVGLGLHNITGGALLCTYSLTRLA